MDEGRREGKPSSFMPVPLGGGRRRGGGEARGVSFLTVRHIHTHGHVSMHTLALEDYARTKIEDVKVKSRGRGFVRVYITYVKRECV